MVQSFRRWLVLRMNYKNYKANLLFLFWNVSGCGMNMCQLNRIYSKVASMHPHIITWFKSDMYINIGCILRWTRRTFYKVSYVYQCVYIRIDLTIVVYLLSTATNAINWNCSLLYLFILSNGQLTVIILF